MAREFIDGFESGSDDLWVVDLATSIRTSSVIDGVYSFAYGMIHRDIAARSEYYGAFKCNNYPTDCINFRFANGTTILSTIIPNYSSGVKIYRGATANLIATGSIILSNTTTLIEFYYKPSTGSDGRFVVKINGIVDVDFTGQTANDALQIDRIYLQGLHSDTRIDDVVIDTSDYPGSTNIIAMVPTGAGTTTQYTQSTGANYSCVDEIPYSDTDYVYTNVPDVVDSYAATNFSSGIIGSVKCVQVQARACFAGSPAVPNIAPLVRSGSTNYAGASQALTTSYTSYCNLWELNPATSTAWTESSVNAMEIGVKAKA